MSATRISSAWSCTVRLVVEDETVLAPAAHDLAALLARVDSVASRFRPDSALSIANARAGRPTSAPAMLVSLIDAALDAAVRTGGAVDPTLGAAMHRIGYDRDISEVGDAAPAATDSAPPVGRWRSVRLHREAGLVTVPVGCALDLGATAKAWTADRAARTLAGRYGTGVLVELGGDVAVAGPREGGWVVRVAERAGGAGQLVRVRRGGVATSTTTVRAWRQGGLDRHHIIDPRTGEPADGPWRTVSVAASSTLLANTASTAAIVLGADALDWLRDEQLAARLVARDGAVVTTPGWPSMGPPFLSSGHSARRSASATQESRPTSVRLGAHSHRLVVGGRS